MSSPSPLTPSLSCLISSKLRSYRPFSFSFPAHRSSLTPSFDALELYIQTQKALLSHTQSDIDRLRLLRKRATVVPERSFFLTRLMKRFFKNYLPSLTHSIHTTHNSSMIMSPTWIINLISLQRFKKRSIGAYSKDKVHCLPLPLHHNLRKKKKIPPPFAPLPLISVQRTIRDRNYR